MNTRKLLFVGLVCTAAGQAFAGMNGPPLQIQAVSPTGQVQGELTIDQSVSSWVNGTWYWHLDSPIPILDSTTGDPLGLLSSCTLTYQNDPIVNLNFTLTAGAATTHFIVSSAQLSFPAMLNPTGDASGGYSMTDSDHVGGALSSGNFPAGKLYRSFYNGFPGGTTFANLVNGVAAPLNGTNGNFDSQPTTPIAGSVSDMSAQWDFNLSANDSLSATSTFEIVPAPGAASLLVLGGLTARRRRR